MDDEASHSLDSLDSLQERALTARSRRQGGSVMLFLLTSFFVLMLMATYSMALGQGFVAREQLQTIADASARAAVAMVRDGSFELGARDIAGEIAQRTVALEPGILFDTRDITFGDYDYATRVFTPRGDQNAPAVRVNARRTSGSHDGPVNLAMSLFFRHQTLELQATSVATFGCREIVIAIDASGGMEEEFPAALQLARDLKQEMVDAPRSGDKIGLTFYAADGATLSEYASGGGAHWIGGSPSFLSHISTSGSEIDSGLAAFGLEGTCQNFRDRLPGEGRGSCAGKGDNWGIDQALELFELMEDETCSVSRERLIVLISSGMPCAVFGPAVGDFSTPFYGGTTRSAQAAADRADALGVSIQPIRIDVGDAFAGDYCKNKPLARSQPGIPSFYFNSLRRGFVESALTQPGEPQLEELIEDLNKNLTVRLVQ